MELTFRPFTHADIPAMTAIWNDILEDGVAFPGLDLYNEENFERYMSEQDAATVMLADGALAGFFIVHPNNIGRCSHTANASYCMDKRFRGMHIGRPLVERSLTEAKQLGFKGMQFNAVVTENLPALHIYYAVGFEKVGTIPGGFLLKDGRYCDMLILYRPL